MEKDGHRQLYWLSFLFSGLYGRTVHLYFGGMDVCIASDGKSGGSFGCGGIGRCDILMTI